MVKVLDYAPAEEKRVRLDRVLLSELLIVKTPTQPQHNLTQPEVGFDIMFGRHN